MPQDTHTDRIKTLQMANAMLLPEVVRLLEEGHTVTLPLRGFSMRPFLEDGRDKALLKLPEAIRVGDAVLAEIAPGATAIGFYRKGRETLDSTSSLKWRV